MINWIKKNWFYMFIGLFLIYIRIICIGIKSDITKSYNIPDTNLFIHKAYTDTIIVKRQAPQWLKAL